MKINKIMSIGSCCDSMFLCDHLGLREKGPVDNMGTCSNSITDVIKLFNGDFLKSIITNNFYYKNENPFAENIPMCFFDGYFMMHNDYRLKKTKITLLERLQKFYNYCKLAEHNKNYFFIYSIIWNDERISNIQHQKILNYLPKYVKNRLIIINGRLKRWNFETESFYNEYINISNYPIFYYDTDELKIKTNKEDIINKFNLFWKENKWFYENLNNCKYDNIKNGES